MSRVASAIAWAAGCGALAAAQRPVLGATGAFEQFKRDFGKIYEEVEKEARFAAFVANYEFIRAENAKGHSYTLGLNQFADLTREEFAQTRLGLRPSTKKAWGRLPHLGTHVRGSVALPESVDWRAKGAVQKVKNQAQCGACWAFSTVGALEGAWEIATGQLLSLSEQQLVDCSKNGNMGCGGGLMDAGFEYEEGTAVCTEDSYPYAAKDGVCRASQCTAGIPKGGVVGFKDVASDDEEALMEALAQQPVSVAIEADQMAFQLYAGGVMNSTCGTKLDHGVVAVGYGVQDGMKYWLVRNSWGPSWGEGGYIKLARGIKAKEGECGIQMSASYPVVDGTVPPAPPSPPAPSPPAPAGGHYEHPPCQADEVAARVQGADGALCAPPCTGSSGCPADVPAGTKATPQCVLQDSSSGSKYCALTCASDAECPAGAKCDSLGFTGLCVYPDAADKATLSLEPPAEAALVV